MSQSKPNLFVVGAMKSGTTYLSRLLASHPLVFMSTPEEPSFFADPDLLRKSWPYMWRQGYWKSEDHYLALFQSAHDAVIRGESSTIYTKQPLVSGVPEKIQTFNPEARIIYLLRDPVERTISHYWHAVRFDEERRTLDVALKEDPHYRDVSNYAMQIEPFLTRFGAERVRVITHEELTCHPEDTMHSVFEWLGVGWSGVDTSSYSRAENVTPEVVNMAGVSQGLWKWKQSALVSFLYPYLPSGLRSLGRRLTSKEIPRDSMDTGEIVKYLRAIQIPQTEVLRGMLGRDFPHWKTLYGRAGKE